MLHYYQYRFAAFKVELRELRRQLAEFSLLLASLFFIYLPGLALGIFYALGKIVQFESESDVIYMTFGFLLLQSLLLHTLKSAVLDMAHRNYHGTLLKSRFHQWVADQGLLLLCHVLFLFALFLAVSMGWQSLLQAPQFMMFMLAQLILAITLLYRPISACVILITACLLVFVCESFKAYYLALALTLVGSLLLPRYYKAVRLNKVTAHSFWWQWTIVQPWAVLWRLGMTILTYWCTWVIVTERPDLKSYYAVMAQLFNVLWWSSLLIDTNKQTIKYRSYWQTLSQFKQVQRSQCIFVASLTSVMWLCGLVVLGSGVFEFLTLFVTPVMMWVILRSVRFMALTWAVAVVTLMLTKILVS
ncbi:DUF6136 family protein [Pseudoalteromonas luteoviolacea]|uniref:Uncharacterized protein n=1 Tax=Pseudoalteromonas luteoviolacea S4054 TaxID=1129367 RepID=A0A0F6A5Y6_9GAMM|nr:DUF6136 family protein [Pseudoalteromonas luteoviolacea]AOT09465.1 hypothetical protein S4054249_17120 [Pseudoalteromonas luteoviolacea]AOT14377.1 hypothetical protein S40542_17090 [Pseudoalteromonas luteoviolacea]AOT19293.1 hypothetical protein S4054_17095 [Pseudoalteromonas luteoviolacea]KKE81627.1 hypothetical protein N479_21845 [Pseudoalteromonas luteoviolacea S4054]KZN72436.1 hypothetical protein N481_15285 [Pseudoalteromonas luteoviolacea S4047-1]